MFDLPQYKRNAAQHTPRIRAVSTLEHKRR